MDWLEPAAAIGLIIFASAVFSLLQIYLFQSRAYRRPSHGRLDSGSANPRSAPYSVGPETDALLHLKIDQLLARVPRSTFWRNTTWAIAGYGLAKLADYGLYSFLGV